MHDLTYLNGIQCTDKAPPTAAATTTTKAVHGGGFGNDSETCADSFNSVQRSNSIDGDKHREKKNACCLAHHSHSLSLLHL
mmetsp:Transcript_79675/g.159077  ORF Transcript_79675/g.159077 Transcript_79675/m.159077 type:complete len:81 (+) Transcript_79675:101-343(+)